MKGDGGANRATKIPKFEHKFAGTTVATAVASPVPSASTSRQSEAATTGPVAPIPAPTPVQQLAPATSVVTSTRASTCRGNGGSDRDVVMKEVIEKKTGGK